MWTFYGMHYDYYPVINCFHIENYVERSLSGIASEQTIMNQQHRSDSIRHNQNRQFERWRFDELLLIRTRKIYKKKNNRLNYWLTMEDRSSYWTDVSSFFHEFDDDKWPVILKFLFHIRSGLEIVVLVYWLKDTMSANCCMLFL